ncbi:MULTISPECIES: PACE efflux transporter [Burkholderia]|uniref:Chlorhexidine efflux transporter domain-containing protein n=1 Tax=Burkholderia contaminans TaxID=488447 RepID=A0A2S5E8L6_9BURK|nr:MULTISPECIES: PACE efflux transporter [Burkholderia]EKS9794295.1 PACE efflux transporter [Burkholderia cepacia]EKS9802243.1 PACE efflux transporter [Burkholderia cepacia]EKS9811018.1 PACE efflux transporter [Burkholderia cepacia]EKS9816546.1 PACE efflux transporter [Burkholderia cepacia]EKS9825296.1 PACE efflux transporter [Burkholderia cepacia]
MQGWKRRIVYVVMFEVLGILIASSVLGMLSGASVAASGLLGVMISTTGVTVNFLYNLVFEAWERRSAATTRTVGRRVLHAIGFQIALVTFLIPLIAWWLDVSLLQAFLYDAVLIVFFPIFTFTYNWAFDSVFGLPDAVTRKAEPEPAVW